MDVFQKHMKQKYTEYMSKKHNTRYLKKLYINIITFLLSWAFLFFIDQNSGQPFCLSWLNKQGLMVVTKAGIVCLSCRLSRFIRCQKGYH